MIFLSAHPGSYRFEEVKVKEKEHRSQTEQSQS